VETAAYEMLGTNVLKGRFELVSYEIENVCVCVVINLLVLRMIESLLLKNGFGGAVGHSVGGSSHDDVLKAIRQGFEKSSFMCIDCAVVDEGRKFFHF